MQFTAALSPLGGGTVLSVHVVPGSWAYGTAYDEWRKEIRVWIKAEPKEGKANKDLIQFLERFFKNPVIVSGGKRRSKRIRVENTIEETVTILGEILGK